MSLTFEHTEVYGFEAAIRGMRNPYKSGEKSDSRLGSAEGGGTRFVIGKADMSLAYDLIRGGTEHATFTRLIQVWTDITGPRLWWTEMDRYRIGKEQVSESTMHTITKRPFTDADFSGDPLPGGIVADLNSLRELYLTEKSDWEKARIKRSLLNLLPQSYNQKRTVMMSYQTVRKICKERKGHFLSEWADFRKWAADLPESWMVL